MASGNFRFFLVLVVLVVIVPGCGKREDVPATVPSGDSGANAVATLDGDNLREVAGSDGIFPAQPLTPEASMPAPAPMSPPRQALPLPLQRPTDGLLVPSRQELPRTGVDTSVGGGGGGALGRPELLIDSTRPEMRGGYYIFGLDYVAAITDMDNNGNFAPSPSISAQ